MTPDREPGAVGNRPDWRDAYLRVREREGRRLPDALVATLPDVPRADPRSPEWRQRADSCARLVAYLRARPRPLTIVDVGCGNGWLAGRMARIDGASVVGVDAVAEEIDQARRVFGAQPRLEFVCGEIVDGDLPGGRADVAVLASVVQYVPDPARLVASMLTTLGPGGEVHVLDSPLYRPAELAAARERTREHYGEVGVPEMTRAYHHHTWESFASLHAEVLYRPDSVRHRFERRVLRRPRSPFAWLRFRSGTERGT
jgi:SAM-dependent methyltransferase